MILIIIQYIARFMLPRRELKRMMKIEQEAKVQNNLKILKKNP